MRKMYKRKRRSCGVCKPGKKGITKRWSLKDEHLLREFDRERRWWTARG
jgi:hypothetical protein